jgi:RES domain-containing protein
MHPHGLRREILVTDDTFHELAMKRFNACQDAESENRSTSREERDFEAGEQWPKDVKAIREGDPNGIRPCLTLNRVPAFKRQVINELRQQNQQIKVRAVDSKTDPEAANIYAGLIRAIEESCNADAAYIWGADNCVSTGWGYWRINTEWDGDSFEQNIVIKRIFNQSSVFLDPGRQEPDGSDARFGFIVSQIPKDTFEERWPDANPGMSTDGNAELNTDWYGEQTVTIAEYWYKDEVPDGHLVLLIDGTTQKLSDEDLELAKSAGVIRQSRKIMRPRVFQAIISGSDVLEKPQQQPGRYIPIVEMRGTEEIVNGRIRFSGIIRDLMDPQRQYNYMRSAIVERVALEPRAPFVGYQGQFQDPKWKRANRYNYAYLEATHPEGFPRTQPLPLPQRNPGPQLSPGLSELIAMSAQELKDISGIQDPGLGSPSPDISGVAINARRSESDVGQYHYSDAMSLSKRQTGRILISMIPEVYGGTRAIQIVNGEGEREPTVIGPGIIQGQQGVDISVGRYDIVVDTGPSYATRREETQRLLFELAGYNPEFARLTADWLIKNSDAEGAEQIAKRFRTLLPPAILEDENPEVAMATQELQQQLAQMQEALQLQTQQMQQMAQALQDKDREQEIDEREVERKETKDAMDYAAKMTDIEAKSRPDQVLDVPGSRI